ncbi:type II glyceraldehyde-3-phosphate dehydrogenase [Hoeflea sp.]|uniref:type II glyceraldehyde-3-phosphate dehydrogenase n=1 Tax=Hoeflea sp. TaxID=1940281 RepID=UPI0025C24EA5|nr:type II glyceraldehyde-3-phosphate dehydrogenase [Hoeflea sp.]
MSLTRAIRVAVNGYGVIGKRVADAVVQQDDMELAGVADISADWRPRIAMKKGFRLFGATEEHASAMRNAGLDIAGNLDDLLGASDLVVDCTPKRIAAVNVEIYRKKDIKFIVQGGEKHEVTGHSFVAEASYSSALYRDSTRVVSCNTTSIVRTLTGTVNLSASGQGRARGLRSGYLKMGDLAPHLHRGPSQLAIMVR